MTGPSLSFPKAPQLEEPVTTRMLALMRVVLAAAALVAVFVDPPESGTSLALLHAALVLFAVYGVGLLILAARRQWRRLPRAVHWTDTLAFTTLLLLTDGVNSMFFNFFLFAVLAASFSYGLKEGLRVLAAALMAFVAIGLILGVPEGVEVNRAIIRVALLLAIGYLVAYWGGQEQSLRQRLALLNEINADWEPRAGSDHLIGANLNRLMQFFDASSCLLLVGRRGAGEQHLLYTARLGREWHSSVPVEAAPALLPVLLDFPEGQACLYRKQPGLLHPGFALDARSGQRCSVDGEKTAAIAELLEAETFVGLPYVQRDGVAGRLYIVHPKELVGRADVLFAIQAARAMAAVVENVALTEELVARASEHERLRISHDLHDTTIQPYIALKLALDALLIETGPHGAYAKRLQEIVEMTEATVRDLRRYASGLKEKTALRAEALVAGIGGQAERFDKFYGLSVDLRLHVPERISDRVATETYQIVAEGLSNILRHTSARKAFVHLYAEGEQLVLRIGNALHSSQRRDFMPRSIAERVQMLGGWTRVEHDSEGYAVVSVRFPMVQSL